MRIKDYIRELALELQVGGRRKRRILHEIEEHLLEAAYREEIAGASREEAERRAVERFGPAKELATHFSDTRWSTRRRLVATALAAGATVAITLGALNIASGNQRHNPTRSGSFKNALATVTGTSSDVPPGVSSVTYQVTFGGSGSTVYWNGNGAPRVKIRADIGGATSSFTLVGVDEKTQRGPFGLLITK